MSDVWERAETLIAPETEGSFEDVERMLVQLVEWHKSSSPQSWAAACVLAKPIVGSGADYMSGSQILVAVCARVEVLEGKNSRLEEQLEWWSKLHPDETPTRRDLLYGPDQRGEGDSHGR